MLVLVKLTANGMKPADIVVLSCAPSRTIAQSFLQAWPDFEVFSSSANISIDSPCEYSSHDSTKESGHDVDLTKGGVNVILRNEDTSALT